MASGDPPTDWTSLLPHEILMDTFALLHAVQMENVERNLSNHEIDYISAILPLSGVCRYWREILHNDPRLWTHIKINLRGDPREKVAMQIRLSKSCQIFVLISWSTGCGEDWENPLWNILHEALPRCQELTITSESHSHLNRLLRWADETQDFPCLSKIRILCDHLEAVELVATSFMAKHPVHTLREVRLSNCNMEKLNLNWNFITKLELDTFHRAMSPLSFVRLLSPMVSLQYLNLSLENDPSHWRLVSNNHEKSTGIPPRTITLPSLRTLVFQAYQPSYNYLVWIFAPRLRTLVLSHLSSYTESIGDVLARNFPSIQELKLINVSIESDQQILALPLSFPSIITLSILHTNWSILYNFAKHYILSDPRTWLNLRKLVIGPAVPPLDIVNFKEQRRRSGHPLSTICTDEEGLELLEDFLDHTWPKIEVLDLSPPVQYDIGLKHARYAW